MKKLSVHRAIPVWLCLGCLAVAQEKRPAAPAAVEGIKGVKEEAAAKIKNIEPGNVAVPKNTAQGVNKVDGVNTVNGVKADGRTVVLPPPPAPKPVAPPPPPIVGTAVNVAVGTVGTGAVRPVTGVTGINAAKLQNLEAALAIKGGGPEKGAKGKAAAAALLGAPGPGPKAGPKTDGRAGFQEFEKLITPGS